MATNPFTGQWINPDTKGDLFGGLNFNSMFSLANTAFSAQGAALGASANAAALGASIFGVQASAIGIRAGAAADLFLSQGALAEAQMKAEGLNLNAAGLRIKATGDLAEAANYDLAAHLARKNKQYTEESTRIQEFQLQRKTNLFIGEQVAGFGAAGLKTSGSATDILRESATQGALSKAVLQKQGLIQEESFEEAARSYETMSHAARFAAAGEMDIANKTDQIAGQTLAEGQLISEGYQQSSAAKLQQAALTEQQIPLIQQQQAIASRQAGVMQGAAVTSGIGSVLSGIAAVAMLL